MNEVDHEETLPIPDAFGEGVQQAEQHSGHTVSEEHTLITSGWHIQLVNGNVFITAEPPSTLRVVLNAKAASDLLAFLAFHQEELLEHQQKILTLVQQPEEREPGQKMDPSV
jgi:hypothetical protein